MKTPEQLQREDLERQTLESAAKRLESQGYQSEAYRKAMKTAAGIIRGMKDRVGVHPQCTDTLEKIRMASSDRCEV